jgi:hypothetical protein
MPRGLVRRAFRFAALGILFLGVLEICARVDDLVRWDAPFWGDYSNDQLTVNDSLGRRCRPHAQFEKWRLNGFGFRGPEVSEQKPTGIIRIMTVGASETFGLYEPAGQEFPAQLQDVLDQRHPAQFQVLNAACMGMSPPRIDYQMKTRLHNLAPDVVLFYPSPQFYLDEDAPRLTGGDVASPVPHFASRLRRKAKIALKSFLPGWLQTWFRQLDIRREVRRHGPDWVWTQSPADRVALFQEHLTNLLTTIQASGARALLLTHANRFGDPLSDADREQLVALRVFYPKATDAVILDFERTVNRVVMDTAIARGVPAVDVDRALGKNPQLFADFSHFTEKGAAAVARLLGDEVERLVFATATTPQGARP